MREKNITARVGIVAGRRAPQKRVMGRSAKSHDPMPWCKHPSASTFGRLCSEQLKAYKV